MTKTMKTLLFFTFLFILVLVAIFVIDIRALVYDFFSSIGKGEVSLSYHQLLNLVVMLFVFVVFAFIGYRLSKKKRRNQILWTILCFLFNVWAVLVLWFLPILKKEKV
jgi:hypothetical protein